MSELTGRILLVDDDPSLRRLLSIRLTAEGHDVECAENGAEALTVLERYRPDLVITDLRMEELDGISLLQEVQRRHPTLPVLIITAHGTIPDAVSATQGGAYDFLSKPIDKAELQERIERALQISGQRQADGEAATEVITRSPAMRELLAEARMIAVADTSVLITGESGTGKELLARVIHGSSRRANKPFVAINCSAMPEQLLESELFGHKKGAFTDAKRDHIGLFRTAEGGTLLLDEIGDMPAELQAKLLRVLQERSIRPVGGTQSIAVDVRVISATHRDLSSAMARGEFREDLYYRLNVVSLHLPPLAERREDIPLLAQHFLQQVAGHSGKGRKVYAPEAMEMLVQADWPGNIRQLANVVEQNVALSTSRVINTGLVARALGQDTAELPSYDQARADFTRQYLVQLLQITGGNVSRASRLAERNRTDFYKLLSRHSVDPADFKGEAVAD